MAVTGRAEGGAPLTVADFHLRGGRSEATTDEQRREELRSWVPTALSKRDRSSAAEPSAAEELRRFLAKAKRWLETDAAKEAMSLCQ